MAWIEWSDGFLVGVPQFDDHHRHLVALLNRTHGIFVGGAAADDIGAVLDELVDYATYHFATEEYWMKEQGYPELGRHAAEHDAFSVKIVGIQMDHQYHRRDVSLDVLTFLKEWLSTHILEADAGYGRFVVARGKP